MPRATPRLAACALVVALALPLLAADAAAPRALTIEVVGAVEPGKRADVAIHRAPPGARIDLRLLPEGRATTYATPLALDGPHVHAPQQGWVELHVEAPEGAAVADVAASSSDFAGRSALARAPERSGTSVRVPMLFPWSGNWTVTLSVGGEPLALPLYVPPSEYPRVRQPLPPGNAVIAREAPVLVAGDGPVPVRFTVHRYDAATGAYAPLGADARATVAGVDVETDRWTFDVALARDAADPSVFAAPLPLAAGRVDLFVNVTGGGAGLEFSILRAAVLPVGSGATGAAVADADGRARFAPLAPEGRGWRLVAHAPGAHGDAPLARGVTGAPFVDVAPAEFPAPGRVEGALILRDPRGEALDAPEGVTAALDGAPLPLARARGALAFAAELAAGEHVVRVSVPATPARGAWSAEAVVRVRAAAPPTPPTSGEAPPDGAPPTPPDQQGGTVSDAPAPPPAPVPWARWLALGGVAAAALAGLAWALIRHGRFGDPPP